MPRGPRIAPGGFIYHVLNRASSRVTLFEDDDDYLAFERVLAEAIARCGTRLLAYCVMPNHWHLILWPTADGELSACMGWLTTTHVRRWHQHRHTLGHGHVYQGRFKSFPIQADRHLLVAGRYVERNALRAGLVQRAEDWRWCSLARRERGHAAAGGQAPAAAGDAERPILSAWPVDRPADWLAWVNEPQTDAELEQVRSSTRRGRPFGDPPWQEQTARRMRLEFTFRRRGPVPGKAKPCLDAPGS